MTPVALSFLLPKNSPEPLKAKWLRHNYNLPLHLAAVTCKKQCVTPCVLTVLIRLARNNVFSASFLVSAVGQFGCLMLYL
jgi:hypothetical protein